MVHIFTRSGSVWSRTNVQILYNTNSANLVNTIVLFIVRALGYIDTLQLSNGDNPM